MDLSMYPFILIIAAYMMSICVCLPLTLTEHSEHNLEDLFTNFTEIQKQLNELQTQVQLLQSRDASIAITKETAPNDVYFTANPSIDLTGLAIGHKVVYGNDFSNVGGGYDPITGVFTAPLGGVYMFTIVCDSLKASNVDLIMIQDGTYKGNCVTHPSYDGKDDMGSNVFIGRLDKGDKMWVEVFSSSASTVELKKNFNTFAGVLLHA